MNCEAFCAQFGVSLKGVVRKGSECFLVDEELQEYAGEYFSAGVFLGKEKKEFEPSLALLDEIGADCTRRLVVGEKAEWLFLCGRNILEDSVIECSVSDGLVLVYNEREEVLGLAQVMKNQIFAKNVLHKGWYLGK